MELNHIYQGDVLAVLKTFPNECVDMVMTSPPYWGLRDYGTEGQIGLEPTPEEYVAKMVGVFREVKRVLKKGGTVWLNLGDSYAGNMKGSNGSGGFSVKSELQIGNVGNFVQPPDWKIVGLKPKDLVGIPWRVAFALQADGWYLRQDIIWHKPNPMPESVTDRCTKSHEYLFLLAKSHHYYYDNEVIKEDSINAESYEGRRPRNAGKMASVDLKNYKMAGSIMEDGTLPSGQTYPTRNKRSVWTITTKPFSEAHFATFPEELCEIPIKAGTSEKGVCPECGKLWERILEHTHGTMNIRVRDAAKGILGMKSGISGTKAKASENEIDNYDVHNEELGSTRTLGWQPTCQCDKQPVPAVVMDIFSGSGTTSVVAKRLGRNYVGIELNPEYVKMSEQRLELVGKENLISLKTFRKTIKEHRPLTDFAEVSI